MAAPGPGFEVDASNVTSTNGLTDVAFHTTEAVVTASLASQVIRGPLGRSRPDVTGGSDQYDFHWFGGFGQFDYRRIRWA